MSKQFWLGYGACIGFHMAWQDWLGVDRYVAMARADWIALPWALGASLWLACILISVSRRRRRKAERKAAR